MFANFMRMENQQFSPSLKQCPYTMEVLLVDMAPVHKFMVLELCKLM